MGLLAGPGADRCRHLRHVPASAPQPVCELGRRQEFPREPALPRAWLDPAQLDVDHAPGPLHSADVDDLRLGLPALGHEPPRLPPDQSPSARGHTLAVSAAFAALVFAIHPLRVESVAWATERRDVLSGLFYLSAVLA